MEGRSMKYDLKGWYAYPCVESIILPYSIIESGSCVVVDEVIVGVHSMER
jgi:hypothetical protein